MQKSDQKPFAPAAERNKYAILSVMQGVLRSDSVVFEFGSGTGQHACHIASSMPHITWQPTDLNEKLEGIMQWIQDSGCQNILKPIELDLKSNVSLASEASACFTANTLHIVSWTLVSRLFELAAEILGESGALCIYGPFMFEGKHTSEGNLQFDKQLRLENPNSGIREFTDLQCLALECGFNTCKVYDMPANNHLLVWRR